MFLLTGSLAMMNDGLRDAFDPSSSSTGNARKSKARTMRAKKKAS
jgi:peptide/nickel transport system permease protein